MRSGEVNRGAGGARGRFTGGAIGDGVGLLTWSGTVRDGGAWVQGGVGSGVAATTSRKERGEPQSVPRDWLSLQVRGSETVLLVELISQSSLTRGGFAEEEDAKDTQSGCGTLSRR